MVKKSRGILVAGNWKMNHGLRETEAFFKSLKTLSEGSSAPLLRPSPVLFVPSISLVAAREGAESLGKSLEIEIGAQNAHWEKKGAFTGEVSGPMLEELGVRWVLVGHSERRQYFGETDETVCRRTESLLKQGFHVVTCIGETREERERGETGEVLARQLSEGLFKMNLPPETFAEVLKEGRMIVAYEPVWAIGTGLSATPTQAREAHELIRRTLAEHWGRSTSDQISLLYGGSVTPENAKSYFSCPDVDGVLVGGASLKPEGFLSLLKAGADVLLESSPVLGG